MSEGSVVRHGAVRELSACVPTGKSTKRLSCRNVIDFSVVYRREFGEPIDRGDPPAGADSGVLAGDVAL